MTDYSELQTSLVADLKTWLVAGIAGFIGSNLWETLLKLNQCMVEMDNFSTDYQHNFYKVQSVVTTEQCANFQFFEDDIRNLTDCH